MKMKTLDEVIKAIDFCKSGDLSKCEDCPYIGTCELDYAALSEDALHYLKEYKKYNDTMCALPDYYEWVHSADNPPLTWDELREMEGKPVWIELGLLRPRWYLIEGIKGDQLVGVDALSIRVPFYKDGTYTGGWQAYRKERR